jgi:hypothetical protein
MHNSLPEILETHAALDKVAPGQSEEQYGGLDLEWNPTVFIVVTAEMLDEKGLLVVYVDDEVDDEDGEDDEDKDEATQLPIDKLFFN